MTSQNDLITTFFRLLSYYRQRIWWITSRVIVLTVAITAVRMAVAPKYVARAKLSFMPTRSEINFASTRRPMDILAFNSPASLVGSTHTETILSRSLAEDVARALQSDTAAVQGGGSVAGFIFRWVISPVMETFQRVVAVLNTGRWITAVQDPVTSLAQTIQSRSRIDNLPGSFVFRLGVTWEDPRTAAKIANLMTEHYVQMATQNSRKEMQTTREQIVASVSETEKELELLDKKIKEYRVSQKLYTASSDMEMGLQELSQYVRDLSNTRANREQLDARINSLKAYQAPNSMVAIEAERSGLKARQNELEKVIEEQFAKLDKLPAKESGLLDLYRERIVKERALATMQERLLDSNTIEVGQTSPVRVIDPAIPPLYPERPLLLRSAGSSVIVGLLLSVGFVLLVESRRAGLRCRADLCSKGNALIGLVPYVAMKSHENADAEKSGKMAEVFRSIAHGKYGTFSHRLTVKRHLEHLFVRLADSGRGQIRMLISVNGGEGKTFLIWQLTKLAGEAGRKVLLIDANLDKPALHLAFGKQPVTGLAEILCGSIPAGKAVIPINGNTDLICAGLKRPNTQVKWAIEDVKKQLVTLAAQYDLVLIDSAGLRRDPATTRLLPLATEIVCIFDATTSLRSDLDDVLERFNNGQPGNLSFVLNKILHAADHLFASGAGEHSVKHNEADEPAPDTLQKADSDHDEVEV